MNHTAYKTDAYASVVIVILTERLNFLQKDPFLNSPISRTTKKLKA